MSGVTNAQRLDAVRAHRDRVQRAHQHLTAKIAVVAGLATAGGAALVGFLQIGGALTVGELGITTAIFAIALCLAICVAALGDWPASNDLTKLTGATTYDGMVEAEQKLAKTEANWFAARTWLAVGAYCGLLGAAIYALIAASLF